jgi:hypothetical protein
LFRYAQSCVGLSVGRVASVFGKHVQATGHFAPIQLLFGFGIPEFVSGSGLGAAVVALYSIITPAETNKINEIIKNAIKPPSI